jgi:hypothetical protein
VTMVLGQTPTAPFGGATDVTVGGRRLGLVPVLSGSPHPAQKVSSKNAMNHVVASLYLRMTVILLPLGTTSAAQPYLVFRATLASCTVTTLIKIPQTAKMMSLSAY